MTTEITTEWIYINDSTHPPYKEDVILLTDKGAVIAGYLKSTDEKGHRYEFYAKNPQYYSFAKVLAYQPYPKAPAKEEKQ